MSGIDFIPKRINETPVVFRGMTGREVLMVVAAGFLLGLPIGLVCVLVTGMLAMLPTVAFFMAGVGVLGGGIIMRRLRRGRPPSLMYRRLQYKLAALGWHGGPERLISVSSSYSIRRECRGGRP